MASPLKMLKPGRLLRQRALSRGIFGGDRFWLGVAGVIWGAKFLRKFFAGGDPSTRFIEELKPGQRLVITHPEPARGKRRRSA